MPLEETIIFDDRRVTLKWMPSDSLPLDIPIAQVSAYCIDEVGRILIVKNIRGWGIPGGHPEPGEEPLDTLRREVDEEAAVIIKDPKLIGYVEASDPDNTSIEGQHYAQLRYLTFIDKVKTFAGEHETSERNFVEINALPQYISWMTAATAKGQLDTLLEHIARHKGFADQ